MSSPPSITELIVADSGPLISLGRLDLLSLLARLFGQVRVPQAVLDECMAKPGQDDTLRVQAALDAGWLLVCRAHPIQAPGLDVGECAAIGLALELHGGLLTDDQAARQYAMRVDLPVMGTLGVMVLAKRKELIESVSPLIHRLRSTGQRFSSAAVADALRAAGELDT